MGNMKPSCLRVLEVLRAKKQSGMTFSDLPKGTAYTKRIAEMRALGYHIITEWQTLDTGCRRAVYRLISEPYDSTPLGAAGGRLYNTGSGSLSASSHV